MNIVKTIMKKFLGKKTGRIKLKWEFDAKSGIFIDPCICDINKDGKQEIIFGTKDGTLYVLNNEGKPLWHYKAGIKLDKVQELFRKRGTVNSIYGKPVVEDIDNDGKMEIVFGTESGNVYCMTHDGKLKWTFKTGGAIRNSVIAEHILGDKKKEIMFGSMDKHLYILDHNGKVVLKFHAQDAIESAPVVYRENKNIHVIFGCNDGYVYSIDEKGNQKWKYKTGNKIVTQPVVSAIHKDKKLYILVTSTDHHLYVLNEEGVVVSKFKTKAQIISKPTVHDIDDDGECEIFVGSCDDNVYALSGITQKIWRFETDFWVGAEIKLADIDNDNRKEVIVGSYDKSLYILDAKPSFILEFMPGMFGLVKQNNDYGAMTKPAGKLRGKKIWKYNTETTITGIGLMDVSKDEKDIIVCGKKGLVKCFVHSDE